MKNNLLLFLLLPALSVYAGNHKITEIRQEYKHIESSIKNGSYNVQKRGEEDGNVAEDISVYRNKTGVIRKIKCEGGSEDSFHSAEYYYRTDGTLFFSFLHSANVAGCKSEVRSYFDNNKRKIKEIRTNGSCNASLAYPSSLESREGLGSHSLCLGI